MAQTASIGRDLGTNVLFGLVGRCVKYRCTTVLENAP
jgi:hypothetical protein